jgi:protein farnesyltransferase subunit beta
MDMRGIYCALVVADILNLLPDPEITSGMADMIASCQTYEGGIASIPFGEAHAGYTFCGLATMIILGKTARLDLTRLANWIAKRQLQIEGGFNGRINKLVDSCYNFWLGACAEMLNLALHRNGNVNNEWIINQEALQGYTIYGC